MMSASSRLALSPFLVSSHTEYIYSYQYHLAAQSEDRVKPADMAGDSDQDTLDKDGQHRLASHAETTCSYHTLAWELGP
jgi:hypothetical protein